MLPFTTYNIPETDKKKTEPSGAWLWVAFSDSLQPAEEELLRKICEALQADFDSDVRLISENMFEHLSFAKGGADQLKLIISFGIPPTRFCLWIDMLSHGIRLLENFTIIYADSLSELAQSPVAKKNLWRSMQAFKESQQA